MALEQSAVETSPSSSRRWTSTVAAAMVAGCARVSRKWAVGSRCETAARRRGYSGRSTSRSVVAVEAVVGAAVRMQRSWRRSAASGMWTLHHTTVGGRLVAMA